MSAPALANIGVSLAVPTNRCIVATCNLNNWALDFDGNLERVATSIREAKKKGARFRLGPELELSGYSCEDHFLELDTYLHCNQSLAAILSSDLTDGIICDIGCPILHNNVRYNCRILCLDRKILFIRPKMTLADDGNYREARYFSTWKHPGRVVEHKLDDTLRLATGQCTVKFGYCVLRTAETMIASEICEELWVPDCPNIELSLAGVEIFTNGSGSHHQLRKLDSRLSLMQCSTRKAGGAYIYANHRGGDGGRLYFDGSSIVCVNGKLVAQASQFSLIDVEVILATIDLDDIRSYRHGCKSFQEHSSVTLDGPLNIVDIDFKLSCTCGPVSPPIIPRLHSPEEECALGPACWLWDYLRRSGAAGFLLPLSGGADSASVAAIVRVMCHLAVTSAFRIDGETGHLVTYDEAVAQQVHKLLGRQTQTSTVVVGRKQDVEDIVSDAGVSSRAAFKSIGDELCNSVLHTVYMGTTNSSVATRSRAERLAAQIGGHHCGISIDIVVSSIVELFRITFGKTPQYESRGGSAAEDLALQNIQARTRMVIAYMFAQLLPWIRDRRGFLLVLGSSNVDEALRGYMTKYDCSSADLNPIGGICKGDLKKMLSYLSIDYSCPALKEIADALPTAELRPIAEGEMKDYTQLDEDEMGMTYAELGVFGFLRKVQRCGPVSMFIKLLSIWSHTPAVIAQKVKRFFFYYSVNRHKLTTLTPSYHAENYAPDDNRFDLRQFLYNTKWTRQFSTIDQLVTERDEC